MNKKNFKLENHIIYMLFFNLLSVNFWIVERNKPTYTTNVFYINVIEKDIIISQRCLSHLSKHSVHFEACRNINYSLGSKML